MGLSVTVSSTQNITLEGLVSEPKSLILMTQEIIELERALLENDGVLPPEMEERFNLTTGTLASKVDNYKYVMAAMDARSVYFKDLENQAKAARQIFDNTKDRLKDLLKWSMHSLDVRELLGHDWRFVLSGSKNRLVIDETKLPPKYFKEVKSLVPDKDLIEGDMALGTIIDGVTTEPVEQLRSYVNNAGRARQVKEA